ncbi:hypothetical protein K435DRAFT_871271 [Dendrothele bispora CBS 962.96]|uniref:Uncharacterized protein n=1 Tax=Dendrothele bispora (strain CBS 962.96) TaxID=1314807 RepID=A0A4S8L4X4_DENBC|nr:hypothetical protein K435DRAFT_871271 [Dendrothele bispora CBS 962.96]
MTFVTADSTVTNAIDHASMEEKDHEPLTSGTPTTTVTSADVPGPLSGTSATTTVISAGPSEPPASDTSVATVTNEQDAETPRTVSPSTRTNVIVAQSVQMLHGSSYSKFNNGQFNNAGRDNKIVYNIRVNGDATINMPSQPEHVSDQYTGTGSILAPSAEGIETTIDTQTASRKVQRDASACGDQPSRSCPRTQGKENQQATSTVDRDQTTSTVDRDQTTKSG